MKLIKLILIISVLGQFGCSFFEDHNPRDQNKVSVTDNNGYLKEGEQLPFFGPITKDGQDTLFYQVPKFSLLDQDSLVGVSAHISFVLLLIFSLLPALRFARL